MRAHLAAAVLSCAALAACSSGSHAAADLQAKMNAVTTAANAHDPAALRTAVADLLQEVTVQSEGGDITATRSQALRDAAAQVDADAALLAPTAAPTVPPTAAPTIAPATTPPQTTAPSPSPSPVPTYRPSPAPTTAPPSPQPRPDALPSVGISGAAQPGAAASP